MRHFILTMLNSFDAVATATGMGLGLLSEANPIMALVGLWGILLVKLGPVNGFILFLYRQRGSAVSRIGTWACFGTYVYIYTLHVAWIGAVL